MRKNGSKNSFKINTKQIKQRKIQQISNMELQITALIRTIAEQDEELDSLKIEAEKEELNGGHNA